MKKSKIFIPILIIIVISIVLFDSYNEMIDDLIYEQSCIDNTSSVKSKITEIESGYIILYLYETEDMHLGYATVKKNDSIFNKYSLCSVENIDLELLSNKKSIIRNYNEQNLSFVYGIVTDTKDKIFEYESNKYEINVFEFKCVKLGGFIDNKDRGKTEDSSVS